MTEATRPVLCFLGFVLDGANARLSQGDRVLALRPKTFAVLDYLAANPGRLVPKQELLGAVWPGTAVTDWVLTSCVRELREALGDDARRPTVVETVHGRGYRFVAAIAAQSATPGIAPSASAPLSNGSESEALLVGRAKELATLRDCWRRACAGDRQVLFVLGEPGIGKSALTESFLAELAAAPPDGALPLVASGQCVEQYGSGEPYLPLLEAIERLCRSAEGGRFVELLRRHAPSWLVQLPGLLEPEEGEALERRLGAATRSRMLREIAALVSALPSPLLLVLEDLHWSDHATIDVLSTLAQRRDPARLLLIGTWRPVDVAIRSHPLRRVHLDLRTHGRCRDLWMKPLTEGEVADYLRLRWPELLDAGRLATALHDRSDGNPLYLRSMADYLAADDAIVEVHGSWRLQRDPASLAADVPPDLQQLLAAQIDRLDGIERSLLEAGSVIGRRFSAALVAAALDAGTVAIEQRLDRLARDGLVVCSDGAAEWPDGAVAGAYRFQHFLHQSVLRERIPPALSRQLHGKIAARLEAAFAGHLGEVSTELALHFEAAGDAERAVPHLEESAARALRRGAPREAAIRLEQALAILDPLPATPERTLRTIRLCITLASALVPAGRQGDERVEEVIERACRLSEESGDRVQLFQSLAALTGTHVSQARFARARESSQQLERLLEELPIPPFEFAASLFTGMVRYHSGSLEEARSRLERAVALEDVPLPTLGPDLHAMARNYLALTMTHQGRPDRARSLVDEALARSSAEARPFDRSLSLNFQCMIQFLLRDVEGLSRTAGDLLELADFPASLALGSIARGRVLSARGEHGDAIATILSGLEGFRAASPRVALPLLLATLSECHAAAGDGAAAFACIAEARSTAEAAGEIRYLAELQRLEGALHARAGDAERADRCFRAAIELAREQGARWWELRATTSAGRLLLSGSSQAEQRRDFADALAAIVATIDGEDTTDLEEARQLLAELG